MATKSISNIELIENQKMFDFLKKNKITSPDFFVKLINLLEERDKATRLATLKIKELEV